MAARTPWTVCILLILSLSAARASAAVPAQAAATAPRKTQTIQAQIRTEEWLGWGGGGEQLPEGMQVEQTPQKFTPFPAPEGQPQTFSGKVTGIPPGKAAQVGVVSLIGTHWIKSENYKWQKCEPDGSFTITGEHKPEAKKAVVAAVAGRPWTFLRAEFEPRESARDIEIAVNDPKTVVVTMEDAQGKSVPAFRYEVFTVLQGDAAKTLSRQRLASGSSVSGAMVFAAPLEPFAVLLSANGVAPYYEVLDPRQADAFHFKMIPPSRVRGVVTRGGVPVAKRQILIINQAAPLSASLRMTDAQGRFDFNGRVPGREDIRVGGYATSVQVQPGETAELTIEIGGTPSPVPTVAR